MVLLIENYPGVFFTTTTKVLSGSLYALQNTPNHLKSLKINNSPVGNVVDFCAAILVDVDKIDSAVSVNSKHIGYITCIFKNTSVCRFYLWGVQKYK